MNVMSLFYVFLLVPCFFVLASCESNQVNEEVIEPAEGIKIENIKATIAGRMLETNHELVVLDIRTPEEFKEGHIAKAINIDYKADTFESELQKLDRNPTYLMHCRSGRRSGLALDTFSKLGFKHIIHMDDGILGWKKRLVK